MTVAAPVNYQLITQLQIARRAYMDARIAAMEAMDAENWARWKYQQAMNACINNGIDLDSPPF
jgi:recombinational DNA repair ATPase RecF